MSLIRMNNVSQSYGSQVVLENATFAVEQGEKVGLIGRNGAGKSTILRLITGVERPERGSVILQSRLRIGQIEQTPQLRGEVTVAESVLEGRPELVQMERDLRRLEAALEDEAADHDAILEQYGTVQHEYDRLGGHEFHARASAVLCGLGLGPDTHFRLVDVLSGGQKTRLALARLLLAEPDIMLLDEPTNHLDLDATEWLQSFLQRTSSAVLLVSHDRYLLDAVCDHIIEIEHSRTWGVRGNYASFLAQKAARVERERELFEQQQEQIQKLEAYIRRYKAGNRATQAKSREKMLARLEPLEQPREARNFRLNLGNAVRSGRDVVTARDLGKRYGDLELFRRVTLIVERGERLGLVGPNGAGKTTFIRLLVGQEAPSEGTISIGSNVTVGYFSQDVRTISGNRSIIEEILADSVLDIPAARSMLARFLFTDEEVFKSIADLSGGERNRVALCKILLSRPNLLVLDEPTNHLDIATREGLISALEEFNGTILVASHDRYLLDRVATQVFEIAGGSARLYSGNYSEYRRRRDGDAAPAHTAAATGSSKATAEGSRRAGTGTARVAARGTGHSPAKPNAKASPGGNSVIPLVRNRNGDTGGKPQNVRKTAATASRLERQIQQLESRFAGLAERMNDPDLYRSPEMNEVVEEYDRVRLRLDGLYEEWSAIAG